MVKNLNLFARIVFAIMIAFGIDFSVNFLRCHLCIFNTFWTFIVLGIPCLLIGFALFFMIQKTKFANFVTKRNVNIVCVILIVTILIPSIINIIGVIAAPNLRGYWYCDENEDIYEKFQIMELYKDPTYGWKRGEFFVDSGNTFSSISDPFTWQYDTSSNQLTLTEEYDGWTILLRIEHKNEKYPSEMKTYYINSIGEAPFDAELFDEVSWTKA